LVQTLNKQTFALPPALMHSVAKAQQAWHSNGNTRRLWNADAALWTGGDESAWLGWLDSVDHELRAIGSLREFTRQVRAENFTDVLLLGMGGSSLGPDVVAQSLGSAPGYPAWHMLDSTNPGQVSRVERGIDAARTLFIVSSKSGTTLEPTMLMDYFLAKASAAAGAAAARQFVAITDPGSQLQKTAEAKGFRHVFYGVPNIGGRYSVLSHFGMVPLAVIGHDPHGFLEAAAAMVRACGPAILPAENPGIALGLVIGVLAVAGRDKLTIIASPSIGSFGAWAEQLLAESTGKDGKGVIPVADEPLGEPSVYGADRLFVYLRDGTRPDQSQDRSVDALERGGQPVVRIAVGSPKLLAQEFFRFEIATAVAGAVLGINPFDQPDVGASKIATRDITQAFEKTGAPPAGPVLEASGLALYANANNAAALRKSGAGLTLESWLKAHFDRLTDGDYFALLAYVDATEPRLQTLQGLREALRDRKRVATCLQFGPRFLHSTGQAYKGGPNAGVFLQITARPSPDLAIPGRKASFGVIEAAQARGDFRTLTERGRRALHVHIEVDVDAGLAAINNAAKLALA
jgi:transaldolase/glucose-6-phosphate isomerase